MAVGLYCSDNFILCANPQYKVKINGQLNKTLPSINERAYFSCAKDLTVPERQSCTFLSVIASENPNIPVGSKVLVQCVRHAASFEMDGNECFMIHKKDVLVIFKEEENNALCKKRNTVQK